MTDHLDDCRRLMAAVAPELIDRVFVTSEASGLPKPVDCNGYYLRGDNLLDLDIPGWQAAQHLILLDVAAIAEGLPLDMRADILGVFVHEMGHALPYRPPREQPTWVSPAVAKQYTSEVLDIAATDTRPQDEFHGADFCRMAIHVFCRAAFMGWQVSLTALLRGGPGDGFERSLLPTLLHEAHAMRDQPFADIAATSPPEDFQRLWRKLEYRHGRAAAYQEIETSED